jgi:uncharacterized MAPEG superfamily protein
MWTVLDLLDDRTAKMVSLLSIPAAVVLALYPHFVRVGVLKKSTAGYLNCEPRTQMASLSGEGADKAKELGLTPDQLSLARRAMAAHYNGLEMYPYFGLGVLSALYARVPPPQVAGLSLAFLAGRALYNHVYLHVATTERTSYIRFRVYLFGQVVCAVLFIQAARYL